MVIFILKKKHFEKSMPHVLYGQIHRLREPLRGRRIFRRKRYLETGKDGRSKSMRSQRLRGKQPENPENQESQGTPGEDEQNNDLEPQIGNEQDMELDESKSVWLCG